MTNPLEMLARGAASREAWVVVQFRATDRGEAPDWRELREALEQEKLTGLMLAPPPGTLLFAEEPVWQIKLSMAQSKTIDTFKLYGLLRLAFPTVKVSGELVPAVPSALLESGSDAQAWDIDDSAWAGLVQIYRQIGDDGFFTRDLVQPAAEAPLPGMVLMQRVWTGAQWTGGTIDDAQARQLAQRQYHAMRKDDAGQWIDLPVQAEPAR